eukprot:gene32812-42476_t
MCVLYLLVGSSQDGDVIHNKRHKSSTIIASNRDEFFSRITFSGELICEGGRNVRRFLPTDVEGGGSWLGFDLPSKSTGEKMGNFRFAVVLNYHDWRNALKSARKDVDRLDSTYQTLSRGLLVKNYLTENWASAKDYANSLVDSVNKYRPFNLIIGDDSGVYYISSHHPTPRLLTEGTLYGISNGDELFEYCASSSSSSSSTTATTTTTKTSAVKKMADEEEEVFIIGKWQKLSRGCRLMDERVLQPLRQALILLSSQSTPSSSSSSSSSSSQSSSSSYLTLQQQQQQQQLSTALLNAARSVCDEVLSDRIPLPDPSFGRESAAACQLGAIFVVPTIIIIPSSSIVASSMSPAPSSSSALLDPQASNGTKEEEEEKRRQLAKERILSSYRTVVRQQEVDPTFPIMEGDLSNKLFGTRTSTALVFTPAICDGDREPLFAMADRNLDSSTNIWTSRDMVL